MKNKKNYYIMLLVQSDKDIDYIQSKMNTFIDNFKVYLKNIKNDDFKQALITVTEQLTKKETELYSLYIKYLSEIITREYIFNRKNLIKKEIKNINKNDMYQFYDILLQKYNKVIIY
jgi:insulysin